MKKSALITAVMVILLGTFTAYGKDYDTEAPEVPDIMEQELSGKTAEELMTEVDELIYRYTPVNESGEKALKLLDRVISLEPKNIRAYTSKAYALNCLGRGSEGAAVYDSAIKAIPGDDRLYTMKADYLMELGKYSEAAACYDKALKSKNPEFLKTDSGYILGRKADALYKLKRYEEAIKCYDKVITEGGHYYYSFEHGMNKGMALMELGKYREAAAWFNEFKRHIVPYEVEQYGKVYYYSAGAHAMLKNTAQVLVELEAAIKYDNKYKTMARTEKYFKNIREDKKFAYILDFEEGLLKELKLGEGFYLIDRLTYDINGDKAADEVALVGREIRNEFDNIDQVTLVIVDNKTGKYTQIVPKYTTGTIYSDRKGYLFPYDLNGDGVKDVTVQIGGGNGRPGDTSCSYSFKDNKPVMIFGGEAISEGLSFTAKKVDANTAVLQCIEYDKTLEVDLTVSERDKGRLDEPGKVGGFWQLKLVDLDKDNIYELQGYQGLSGFGSIYGYGAVISTLKYDKTKVDWVITDVEYKWGK